MTVSGFESRFALGVQHASNPATQEFDHFGCDINKRETLVKSDGMQGSRSPIGDGTQAGNYSVGGTVTIEPRADDLTFLFPYILGGTESTDSFPLADTVPELICTVDKGIKVYTYRGMKVNSATFRSSKGGNLSLELNLEGTLADSAGAAGSFPSIAATVSAKLPFLHSESTITMTATSDVIPVDNVVISIGNNLNLDNFNNSQTRTSIPEGPRTVTFGFDTEFGSTEESKLIASAARGISGNIVYADGTDTLTFTFGILQKPETPIPVRGKGLIRPSFNFESMKDLANSVEMIAVTSTDA